jgi:branched-subunit amino acid transport protein AzlD
MERQHVLWAIVVMMAITWGLRALPFLAAQWLQRHPVVGRLGRFLPLAVMVLLVLHSARGSASEHRGMPWPEALAVALVAGLQWRWRQPLPSILLGTALYVVLRQALA